MPTKSGIWMISKHSVSRLSTTLKGDARQYRTKNKQVMSVHARQEDSDKIKKIKRREVLHDPGLKQKSYLGVYEADTQSYPVLIRDFETPIEEFYRNIRVDEALRNRPSARLKPLIAGVSSFHHTTLVHEYNGVSLLELTARQRLTSAQCDGLAKELVLALTEAHERGVLLGRSLVEGGLISLEAGSVALISFDQAGFLSEEADFERFRQLYHSLFETQPANRNDLFQVDYYYLGEALSQLAFGKLLDSVAALEAELLEQAISPALTTVIHYLLSRSVPHFFTGANQILDLLERTQPSYAIDSRLSLAAAAYNYLANEMMEAVGRVTSGDSLTIAGISASADFTHDDFVLSLKQHPQFIPGSGYTLFHYAFEARSNGQEQASLWVMMQRLLESLSIAHEPDQTLEQLFRLFFHYCNSTGVLPFLYLTYADCLPESERHSLTALRAALQSQPGVILLHGLPDSALTVTEPLCQISLLPISLSNVTSILCAQYGGKNEVEFIFLAKWLVKEGEGSVDLMDRLFSALKQAGHLSVDSVGMLRWNQHQIEQFNYAQWREGYIFSLCGLDKKEDILTLCALSVAPRPLTERQLLLVLDHLPNLAKLVSLGMLRPIRLGLELHYVMRDSATSQYFRSKYKVMCAGYSLALMRDFYADYLKTQSRQMAVCLARQLLFHQTHLKPLATEHLLEANKRKFSALALEAAYILADNQMQQEAVVLANTLLSWFNDTDWKQQYALCADILTIYASWHAYCEGFDEPLVQEQLGHLSNNDAARVLEYLISYHKNAARHDKAVECAIKALDLLGLQIGKISLPALMLAFTEACAAMTLTPPERLLERPLSTDKRPGQILSIMWLMSSSTYMFNPMLFAFLVLKSIPLILKADILSCTPNFLTGFGIILVNRLGARRLGDRLYDVAKVLVEKFNMKESVAPVEFYYWAMMAPWSRPLEEVIFNLQNAYAKAKKAGDYEHAAYISGAYFCTAVMSGKNLLQLRRQLTARLPEIVSYKQSTPTHIHHALLDFLSSVSSLKINHHLLSEEPQWVQNADEFDRTALFSFRATQTMHAALLGNLVKAGQAYQKTLPLRDSVEGLPYSSLVDLLALPALRGGSFLTGWKSVLGIFWAARKAAKLNRSVFIHKYKAALGELCYRLHFGRIARRQWMSAYQHAMSGEYFLEAGAIAEMLAANARLLDSSCEWLKLAAQAYAKADATAKVTSLAESNPGIDNSVGLDANFLRRLGQCNDLTSVVEICTRELCFSYAGIWTLSGTKVAVSDDSISITDTRLSTLYRQSVLVEEYDAGLFIMLRLETGQNIEGALIVSTETPINVDRYLNYLNMLARLASAFLHAGMLRQEVDRLNYERQGFLRYQTALSSTLLPPMTLVQTALVSHADKLQDQRARKLALAAAADVVDAISEPTDLEQLKHNQLRLLPGFINLFEEMDALGQQFQLKAEQKALGFQFNNDIPPLWQIFVDKRRIRQIIKNLLLNALNHTEHGGITLHMTLGRKLSSTRTEFIFSIEDTGPGINSDIQRRYFSSQLPEGLAANQNLSTTGLYFTHALVKLLGGNLTVRSEADRGTLVTLSVALETRQADIDWMPEFPVHVLLLNDDPLFAMRAVQSLLEQAGCSVETATTFDEMRSRDFSNVNIAIIDLDLGTTLAAGQIRKLIQARGFNGVLVMLTAEEEQFAQLSTQSEFDYVFKKPFTLDIVKLLMRNFVRRAHSLH